MNVTDYLEKVAYVDISDIDGDSGKIYKSKFDDSYITRVGMEDNVKFLADREITEELTHGVGYSPKDGKWYGWSHRAIYGFMIGSSCKKGDVHYTPDTPEALIDARAEFFSDISEECATRHREECQVLPDRSGIRVLHTPIKMQVAENIEELEDSIESNTELPTCNVFEDAYSVIECGRGEWVAKTMEDAKQMAIDFNSGIS